MDAPPSNQVSTHGGEASASEHLSQKQSHATQRTDTSCPRFTCDRCKVMVKPIADTLPDCKTHLIAGLLFVIGLPFFCFLPYCFDLFGKKVDRCPRCGAFMTLPVQGTSNLQHSSVSGHSGQHQLID